MRKQVIIGTTSSFQQRAVTNTFSDELCVAEPWCDSGKVQRLVSVLCTD